MKHYRAELATRGTDYTAYPHLVTLIDDPVMALRDMYEQDKNRTLWEQIEKRYKLK